MIVGSLETLFIDGELFVRAIESGTIDRVDFYRETIHNNGNLANSYYTYVDGRLVCWYHEFRSVTEMDEFHRFIIKRVKLHKIRARLEVYNE